MTIGAHDPIHARFLVRTTPPKLITLVLIAGLPALAMNFFLPSMPAMAAEFGVDYAVMQFAVSGYLAMTGLLQLMIGPLADRFGRRNVILASFGIFSLATIGCALSPDAMTFLVCRMVQAIVASGIVLSRAVVRDMVPGARAASMIGYATMGMAVMPMLGPMIGGFIGAAFGWRVAFLSVLGFALVIMALCYFDLGETNPGKGQTFREQVRHYPALFRSRRFWGYALISAFASGAFFAFLGGAPYVASQVFGLQEDEIGIYFGVIAGGYMLGNFISGRFSMRLGVARMMLLGTSTAVGGLSGVLVLFLVGFQTPVVLFGGIFFVGFGNGMTMPSSNTGVLSVRPELAGTASGLGGALMIGGGAAWSAMTGALLGPDTGAWPLILMMLASSGASVVATLYTNRIEREVRGAPI